LSPEQSGAACRFGGGHSTMLDIILISLGLFLFAAAVAYAYACDRF
jgi:hypothetical protein